MKPLLALATTLLLAACTQDQPKIIAPAPPSISYRIDNGNPDATRQPAAQYCGQWHQQAQETSVSRSGASQIVQYSCT